MCCRLVTIKGARAGVVDAGKPCLGATMVTTVKKGGVVSIPGFGSFKQHARAARTGVNPSTGEKIKIAASKQAKFKPGKRLRDELN